tara:strand:+ start:752 stop:1255 length:504 start_codon:yes stop_codon:yes gene_type:complete
MLHLRSSNGFENIFSLDVYSRVFSNTISNFGRQNANTRQYTPNFNSDFTGTSYYLLLIEQATQKEYFQLLTSNSANIDKYPRSKQFSLYLDEFVGPGHININTTGLFDYEVYFGDVGATSISDSVIIGMVSNGMALVHNDNFVNDYFQNSENGVKPTIIPNSISYNG